MNDAPKPWETLTDYLEGRQEEIWLERALHDIGVLCDEVFGRGYHSDLKETLARIHGELWNDNRD